MKLPPHVQENGMESFNIALEYPTSGRATLGENTQCAITIDNDISTSYIKSYLQCGRTRQVNVAFKYIYIYLKGIVSVYLCNLICFKTSSRCISS